MAICSCLTIVCGLGAFGPYPPGPPPLSPRNRRPKVAPHSHTEQQKGKHPTEPHENPTETHRVLRKSHRIPPSPLKSHRNPPKIPPAKKGKLVSLLDFSPTKTKTNKIHHELPKNSVAYYSKRYLNSKKCLFPQRFFRAFIFST